MMKYNPHNPAKLPFPDGMMTRREAAAFYGISKNSLIRRLNAGWSIADSVQPPMEKYRGPAKKKPRRGKPYKNSSFWTPYGRMSIDDAAEAMGLTSGAVSSRVYLRGWTKEEALNTPLYKRQGEAFIMPPEEFRRRVQEAKDKEKAEYDATDA